VQTSLFLNHCSTQAAKKQAGINKKQKKRLIFSAFCDTILNEKMVKNKDRDIPFCFIL